MTEAKCNCAQIENELLAIVFACEKFSEYIYGRLRVITTAGVESISANQCNNAASTLRATTSLLSTTWIFIDFRYVILWV